MSDNKIIPLLKEMPPEEGKSCSIGKCGSCGSCSGGGFGIKAGSEKEVVYRNVAIYLIMGLIILVFAYLVTHLMEALT